MFKLVARVVAGVLLASAATFAAAAAPAYAATCGSAGGVSVVVDFHDLGGGVDTACDGSGAGDDAATLLTQSGFSLTYVQRQPGFVCRVNGAPSADPCVNTPPADAYWSLWWSDGTSGTWKYSSVGVGSLTVPAGGSVALSWQGGGSQAPPGVKPPLHATPSSPSTSPPTSGPTSPTSGPTRTPTTHAPTTPPTASGTSGPTATPTTSSPTPPANSASSIPVATPLHASGGPSVGPSKGHAVPTKPVGSPSSTPEAGSTTDGSAAADGGLPSWAAPVVIALLFVTAGVVAVVRRGRTGRHR